MRDFLSQVRIASNVAVISLLGLIPKIDLPFLPGVPITAQTLGVMLSGLMLSARDSITSVSIFLILILIGAPLLSGGRGGLAVFFSPSAGYLIGWLFGVSTISLSLKFLENRISYSNACLLSSLVGGIIVIHLFGVLGLVIITDLGLNQAALLSLAFVPGDVIKCFIACYIANKIKKQGIKLT